MSRRLSKRIMWLAGLWDRGRSMFGILQFDLKALIYILILLLSALLHSAFSNMFLPLSFLP